MRKNIWEIPFVSYILQQVQHYNHAKYWKRRAVVIDASNKASLLKKTVLLALD